LMFGLALLASCRPCHDDWLNEWSSTPPVSRTMHALIAPPAAGAELTGAAALDAGAGAELTGAAALDAGAGAAAEVAGAAALLVAGAGALLLAVLAVFLLLEQPASMIATVPVAAMI
jgi:hypothetical protein